MAEVRRLCVSDLLCYAVNKFTRVALKPLKLTISDFYDPEDITTAKDCLVHEIDALKIEKWTKPPRRR